ncbi:hypothetical protein GQ457_14G004620 [Hibiscus cannabinus]
MENDGHKTKPLKTPTYFFRQNYLQFLQLNHSESVEPASQHFCTSSRKELLFFFFHWNHSKTLRLSFPISSVLPSFLEFGSLVD